MTAQIIQSLFPAVNTFFINRDPVGKGETFAVKAPQLFFCAQTFEHIVETVFVQDRHLCLGKSTESVKHGVIFIVKVSPASHK